MAWYLRAIEQPDGRWECRHGGHTYDLHDELSEALQHLSDIAEVIGPAELFTHWLDGRVVNVGPI